MFDKSNLICKYFLSFEVQKHKQTKRGNSGCCYVTLNQVSVL